MEVIHARGSGVGSVPCAMNGADRGGCFCVPPPTFADAACASQSRIPPPAGVGSVRKKYEMKGVGG